MSPNCPRSATATTPKATNVAPTASPPLSVSPRKNALVPGAAEDAIAHYGKVIKESDGVDYVTQDLCITLMGYE